MNGKRLPAGSGPYTRMPKMVLVLVVLYPLTGVAAATSVYRFVNDQGVTEYAAEPPRDGRHYQIMAVDSPLSAAQAASAERQREALLRAAAR